MDSHAAGTPLPCRVAYDYEQIHINGRSRRSSARGRLSHRRRRSGSGTRRPEPTLLSHRHRTCHKRQRNHRTPPRKATDFLNANFRRGGVIKEVEEEFDNGTFEVDFTDGTDIEFDSSGEWTEVDAGHSKSLPQEIVKKLLPSQAYKEIGRLSLDRCVETVKRSGRGYKVRSGAPTSTTCSSTPPALTVAVEI